jgi:hypothetical protein
MTQRIRKIRTLFKYNRINSMIDSILTKHIKEVLKESKSNRILIKKYIWV